MTDVDDQEAVALATGLGMQGNWTAFSPAECRVVAAALEVVQSVRDAEELPLGPEFAPVLEELLLKVRAGGER